MTIPNLKNVIFDREKAYRAALDEVQSIVAENSSAYDAADLLRESVALVGCLRRLLAGRTVEEIHRAFGAPGDFGYETALGDALNRVYRGEDERVAP